MEKLIELVAQSVSSGSAGVGVVLLLGWMKEWRDRVRLEKANEQVVQALDSIRMAIQETNTSITVMLDRNPR